MRTLEQSLKRKKIDCNVETENHIYNGLAIHLIKLIPSKDLQCIVKHEHCVQIGKQKQWEIYTS